jgi:hypothetical protein
MLHQWEVGKLVHVEFHDAVLSGATLDRQFELHVNFQDLACYYLGAVPGTTQMWWCGGRIIVKKAKRVTIDLPVHEITSLADFEIETSGAPDKSNLSLLGGLDILRGRLLFDGDATISITEGTVYIEIGDKRQLAQTLDWNGEGD